MAHGRFSNPVEAVLTGVSDFLKRKTNVRNLSTTDQFNGKTVLVTGANSGVGFGIAKEVAARGGNLIMACRSGHPEAGEAVRAASGSDTVTMMHLDLTQLDSINALADQLKVKVRA